MTEWEGEDLGLEKDTFEQDESLVFVLVNEFA